MNAGVVATPLTFNSVWVPEEVARNSMATLLAIPLDPALPVPMAAALVPCRTNAKPEAEGPLNWTLKFVENAAALNCCDVNAHARFIGSAVAELELVCVGLSGSGCAAVQGQAGVIEIAQGVTECVPHESDRQLEPPLEGFDNNRRDLCP